MAAVVTAGMLLAVNLPAVASAAPAPVDVTTRPWETLQSVDGVFPPRSPAPVVSSWPVSGDGEVAALRTRMSRTFTHGDGNYQTVSSPVPVNFRDGQGRWTPIDDSLVRQASGVFGVAADSYGLVVPVTAAEPVLASQGTLSVSSVLQGAAAASVVSVTGSTATYGSVLPGVDLLVSARPGSVDQTLRLASAAAPSAFTYAVTVPAGDGLRAEADRSVSVVDGTGAVVGSLPAPVMRDSSGDVDHATSSNVHYEVSGTGPVFTVRVVADADWLADPARVFPVLLDPSVTFGTSSDFGCYVSSPGASDASLCAANSGTDNTLNYGHTGYTRHLLIKFGDLTAAGSAVPADAVISDAALTLTTQSTSGSVALDTGVYRVGAPFTTAITWANQPGVGSIQDHVSYTPPAVGATATFHVGNLVNSWIKGTNPNYGLEVKQTDDTVPASTIAFYGLANAAHPTLTVTWQPTVGQQKWVGAYDHTLSDRMDLHVDLADRNLVLNATDENLSAPGQSLVVRRTYNSRVAAAATGAFGVGWLMSGGTDVRLAINRDVVTFTQPGGAQVPIYRAFGHDDLTQPDAFIIPPGLNADFTMPDSTHYKLAFHASKVVDTFTLPVAGASSGWLSSVKDTDGNTTTFTAAGSPLVTTKATDSTGQRSVGFTYTSGRVTGMAETLATGATGARSWSYGYDGTGHLTSSTDPAGKTARYCYSGALLTRVITPRGAAGGATCTNSINAQTTDISYDAAGAVNTVTYQSSAATPIVLTFTAQTTLAISDASATAVTRFSDPYGKNTDYTYDTTDRVTQALDPLQDKVSTTFTTNNDVDTAVSANNTASGDPGTTNGYDANNNKTSVTLPTGASVQASYAGPQAYLPDTTTDDLGNASSNTYNAAGHLTATTKGGVTVKKVYEGDGGVHCGPGGAAAFGGALCEARDADYSATLPAEHRTAYTYNALGELVTVTPATPDHGRSTPPATTVTYDSHSRPQTVTDGLGNTTTYTYDPLDRLTRLDYANGSYTLIGYDEDGDQTSQADYTTGGVLKIQDLTTYDALDRRATFNNASKGVETMTWDANSRLTGYSDPGGAVTYGYDSAGSLTSVAEPGGSCTGYSFASPPPAASLCTLIQVDKNGARQRTLHPGGLSEVDNTYDKAGRPTEINNKAQVAGALASVADYGYSYKPAGGADTGHVIFRTDKTAANATLNYTYGAQGRLASAVSKNSGGTVTASAAWCYDANGNRTNTSATIGFTCSGTATSSYDGANQQLTSNYGTTGYSYDLNGAELTAPTGATGSTQTRTSTYTTHQQTDTIKPTTTGDVLGQSYLGAGNDERVATDVSATVTDKQINSPLGITATTRFTNGTAGTPTYATRDPQGSLLGLRVGTGGTATHYYTEADNLGSILKVINSAGAVAASRSYDPYGSVTASSGTLLEPFGYTGAYTDTATGLIKLGARYYDTTLGRFTQTDPQTHPDDPNQASPYPYAGDDPINHIDPAGSYPFSAVAATIGGTLVGGALALAVFATCPLSGGVGCVAGAVVAGAVGGAIGGSYGAVLTGATPEEAGDDALSGLIGGAFSPLVGLLE